MLCCLGVPKSPPVIEPHSNENTTIATQDAPPAAQVSAGNRREDTYVPNSTDDFSISELQDQVKSLPQAHQSTNQPPAKSERLESGTNDLVEIVSTSSPQAAIQLKAEKPEIQEACSSLGPEHTSLMSDSDKATSSSDGRLRGVGHGVPKTRIRSNIGSGLTKSGTLSTPCMNDEAAINAAANNHAQFGVLANTTIIDAAPRSQPIPNHSSGLKKFSVEIFRAEASAARGSMPCKSESERLPHGTYRDMVSNQEDLLKEVMKIAEMSTDSD